MIKTLGVDVDGVVADSHSAWVRAYNDEYNDNLTRDNLMSWHTHEWVKPECGKRVYDYMADPALYEVIAPIAGAQTGVGVLRSRGIRVIFVTACFGQTADAKQRWLIKYGFLEKAQSTRDFVVLNEKHLLRVDGLVEDKPENLTPCKGQKYLLSQPWNLVSPASGMHRCANWLDVVHKVTGR